MSVPFAVLFLLLTAGAGPAVAEDGYAAWLRYAPPADAERLREYRRLRRVVYAETAGPTLRLAAEELVEGLGRMTGRRPALGGRRGTAVFLATPAARPDALGGVDLGLDGLPAEGFRIAAVEGGHLIAAPAEIGVLYGAFALLRHLQQGLALAGFERREAPRPALRLLNHWDNLDGSVERGYAGRSLWRWHELPEYREWPRYRDYARLNASIGINGTVLTNVNADAEVLKPAYLRKAAALAEVFRPWGIRVYLTARFSAPREIGGLDTADPLDPRVRAWWRAKVDEIYRLIPDFGGFLVKANSEGQPGPQDYGRTHADGANMLAEALAPHGGVVMWRAFVYSDRVAEDRAKQAYDEFKPLDGRFADNVLVQVKNGPIDFQPREPFHPLFGAMPNTPLMMEFQITQEYLGHALHLTYLAPLYEEVLRSDTYAKGPGSTVAKVIDGSLFGHRLTGIAGVSNIGNDRNWTGHPFGQANWYAFGRLAWDPDLKAEAIANEWVRMTFTQAPEAVAAIVSLMMRSYEAGVDYRTPLGLHHIMAADHHYGPGPWVDHLPRPEWNSVYYHRADREGIGFDRSPSGSNAVAQYFPPLSERWAKPETTPEKFLLWFHHLPWDHRLASGETLWTALARRYQRGVDAVRAFQAEWAALASHIDAERHTRVARLLEVQRRDAEYWKDAVLAYFHTFARRPWPEGVEPPREPLEAYIRRTPKYMPGSPIHIPACE